MQKGTVVYVTDYPSIMSHFDETRALVDLGLAEDWTVVTSSATDEAELHHATKTLIERGANCIEARKARVTEEGRLELLGEPLRIFG